MKCCPHSLHSYDPLLFFLPFMDTKLFSRISEKDYNKIYKQLLTLYQLFTSIAVSSLICICTLVAYFANNMNPDQTAPKGAVWSGFIWFTSMKKSSLKCTWIYAAEVKSRQHFRDKRILAELGLMPFLQWQLFSVSAITFANSLDKDQAQLNVMCDLIQNGWTFKWHC